MPETTKNYLRTFKTFITQYLTFIIMEKTIWTHRLYEQCDFGVYLDKDFEREMIQSRVQTERQTTMNKLSNEN